MNGKIRVYAVVGPTASGKTALAVELAEYLDGEIISCDSMQIYRGMTIGTAKPTCNEMHGIPHHMIDICDPCSPFSCADYTALAQEAVNDITSRGKAPIFCGGTGLYLDSVLTENQFSKIKTDPSLRRELSELTNAELHDKLMAADPVSAENIHVNNVKRVIRALEIYLLTGITKTEWDARSRVHESRYDARIVGLDYHSREILYGRINLRVDMMMNNGLLKEVDSLLESNAFGDIETSTAAQAIGYKEIIDYRRGLCTLDEAVERIKQLSRNYAKRQRTWFCRNSDIKWIYNDDFYLSDENIRREYVNIVLTMLNC